VKVSTFEARLDLEQHHRPMVDKRVSANAAVALVNDGDFVAIGGSCFSRTPMALVFELLRSGRRRLTISRPLSCYEADLFFVTGTAERLVTSWVGIGLRWGLSPVIRRYVEEDLAVYEEWSHLGLGLRFKAGAMGVPFLPTMTMLGSDLALREEVEHVHCPYTGQDLLAVPALNPDVTLLHVHRADMYGNAQIDGYSHMDVDMAKAARRVVISAERIVAPEEILRAPAQTILPHFAVDAVVEAPFGAYPHEVYGRYEADMDHFDNYVALLREYGPDEGVRRYMQDTVMAFPDFDAFLESVGTERLGEFTRSAQELTS